MKPTPTVAPLARPFPSIRRAETLQVAVMGTDTVGLVTAAGLASFGHQVTVLDVDDERIERLVRGEWPVHEVGLDALVREQVSAGRLSFASDGAQPLRLADLVFVAVATPSRDDGSVDMSAVEEATRQLVDRVRGPTVVVLQSTVPVGSAQRLERDLSDAIDSTERVPHVLVLPQFLREGSAVADFSRPDRMIIGDDHAPGPARARLIAAYAPLAAAGVPIFEMDTRSAELAKCAANAMLAARVSFINEIAALASATGADIERVCVGLGSDPRIGKDYLRAGLGYGGACLGKDIAALRETARRHNLRTDMLLATERVNSRQRCWAFDAVRRDLGGRDALRGLRVAVWGLSFKPGTDDMREAPSLALIDRLWRAGAELKLYDPVANENAKRLIAASRRIAWASSATDALDGAEVLLLVTEWQEFLDFDPRRFEARQSLRGVYDGRNALDLQKWGEAGVRVVQVGRPLPGERAGLGRGTRGHGRDQTSGALSDLVRQTG